ncbi:TOS9 [Candida pseudojiufengensis]|uniref:TOS9 n=1 Tax=Candida pseudojiufengensis TaxID=497109 RepID=UPI002224DF92|nr:TOS9 [Candida pseudojiufengensis]KAI5963723.1 TOS9 [Candida pseudojiufengensis]
MSASKINPTYYGYVGSTKDALLIIQEALNKKLEFITRRPQDRERQELIKSGNVFVFIEEQSGIKRWTDGTAWSPSRILGRFLVYRELDKNSLDENDKKRKKRKISYNGDYNNNESQQQTQSNTSQHQQNSQQQDYQNQNQNQAGLIPPNTIPASNSYSSTDYNKGLLSGPLVTSYVFKDQGLIKKTLSLTTKTRDLHLNKLNEQQTIHLISYYNAQEVMNNRLHRPSEYDLSNVNLSQNLWTAVKESSLGGKIPNEDEAFYFLDGNYQLQNMSHLQHQQQQQQQLQQPQNNYSQLPLNPLQQPHSLQQSSPQQPQLQHQPDRMGYPKYSNGNLMMNPQQQPQYLPTDPHVKREDDPNNTGETTFLNPFTGSQHQVPTAGYPNNNNTIHNQPQTQQSQNTKSQPQLDQPFNHVPQYGNYIQQPPPNNNNHQLNSNPQELYPSYHHNISPQQYSTHQQQQATTSTPSNVGISQPPPPPQSITGYSTYPYQSNDPYYNNNNNSYHNSISSSSNQTSFSSIPTTNNSSISSTNSRNLSSGSNINNSLSSGKLPTAKPLKNQHWSTNENLPQQPQQLPPQQPHQQNSVTSNNNDYEQQQQQSNSNSSSSSVIPTMNNQVTNNQYIHGSYPQQQQQPGGGSYYVNHPQQHQQHQHQPKWGNSNLNSTVNNTTTNTTKPATTTTTTTTSVGGQNNDV